MFRWIAPLSVAGMELELAVAHVTMLVALSTRMPRPLFMQSYVTLGPIESIRKALWRDRCYHLAVEAEARDTFGSYWELMKTHQECARGVPGSVDDWGLRFGWRWVWPR
jgi:hypothetical protein